MLNRGVGGAQTNCSTIRGEAREERTVIRVKPLRAMIGATNIIDCIEHRVFLKHEATGTGVIHSLQLAKLLKLKLYSRGFDLILIGLIHTEYYEEDMLNSRAEQSSRVQAPSIQLLDTAKQLLWHFSACTGRQEQSKDERMQCGWLVAMGATGRFYRISLESSSSGSVSPR